MLKLFTLPRGGSIAVNPDQVLYVTEDPLGLGSMIKFEDDSQLVTEGYLETIARLNEKK
jgi:hypothetical protein